MKKQLILLALLVSATITCFAQGGEQKFSFEFRGDVSFPTNKLGDANLKTGQGFEGIFHYAFTDQVGAFLGWGWHHFSSEESFAGENIDFEETGYLFGLQYKYPIGSSPVMAYLRAGGLYDHIEIENSDGEITDDTGHGLGYQIGTGLEIPLGSDWFLTPGIKYQSLSRELEVNTVNTDLDLKHFSLGLGISKAF